MLLKSFVVSWDCWRDASFYHHHQIIYDGRDHGFREAACNCAEDVCDQEKKGWGDDGCWLQEGAQSVFFGCVCVCVLKLPIGMGLLSRWVLINNEWKNDFMLKKAKKDLKTASFRILWEEAQVIAQVEDLRPCHILPRYHNIANLVCSCVCMCVYLEDFGSRHQAGQSRGQGCSKNTSSDERCEGWHHAHRLETEIHRLISLSLSLHGRNSLSLPNIDVTD